MNGPRGFLSNYPEDVVAVVNGKPITKADIRKEKRSHQERRLRAKRRSYEPTIKPCLVWVFWTDGLKPSGFFMGWYLYIHSLHNSQGISIQRDRKLVLKIMRMFPCGYLPIIENFEQWKVAFAAAFHRPTIKRPDKQGMAVAWAVFSSTGIIVDIQNMNGAR